MEERKREREGEDTDEHCYYSVYISLHGLLSCREVTAFGEDDFGATPLHHAARKGERMRCDVELLC